MGCIDSANFQQIEIKNSLTYWISDVLPFYPLFWGARGRWFESSNPDRRKGAGNHAIPGLFFVSVRKTIWIPKITGLWSFLKTISICPRDLLDSDKQRGIFRLNKAIYVSFLLNSLIFTSLVLGIWKTIRKFAADMSKNLYIISGCNGAGKTTASYSVLPKMLDCLEFV